MTSPTHKIFKTRPFAVIVYTILAEFSLFYKQPFLRCLRLSLCCLGKPFFSLPSFLWRQLSEASTPVDYPTNHQSFCNSWEDERACWITSRACWFLFFYSPSRAAPGWGAPPSHHPLCAIALSGPRPSSDWHRQCSEVKLQAQMVFLYIGPSVCLSVVRQV